MNFGATMPGSLDFFDAEMAAEMAALRTLPRPNVDWDVHCEMEASSQQPAGKFDVFPSQAAAGYPDVCGDPGLGALSATGMESADTNKSGVEAKSKNLMAMSQSSTRMARNGREQQRAQKISDTIDQLKGMLDNANFIASDSTSKLHVLVSCESYLRNLQDRTKCFELEAKLRSAASGHQSPAADASSLPRSRSGGARNRSGTDWRNKDADRVDESQSGETDGLDTADGDCSSSSSSNTKADAFFGEENSVGSSGAEEDSGSFAAGAGGQPAGSATESGAGSSVDEDGDAGSSDSGGGETSAGTTDSASRGFTTDSSFSGDSRSADSGDTGSGDAGSADGGSDGSEEGASSARMRVVNYFDIFRLSNVPMAIAGTDGALVDVNDAMRGFGRIDQDRVKTLTVKSLVAPESVNALEDAMSNMLASTNVAQGNSAPPQGGSQPFLANAGIGDRPTVLTMSLVYDERGEASAFHVALIPLAQKSERGGSGSCSRSSTEYNGDAPGLCVDEAVPGNRGGGSHEALGKRSVRLWDSRDAVGSPQKRRATGIPQSQNAMDT